MIQKRRASWYMMRHAYIFFSQNGCKTLFIIITKQTKDCALHTDIF